MKIPGLSFSWKRAIGVSKLKRDFAKTTGIPTTRNGLERKIGGAIINAVFGKKKTEFCVLSYLYTFGYCGRNFSHLSLFDPQ